MKNKVDDAELGEVKPYSDKEVEEMLHEDIEIGKCYLCGAEINLFTCRWDDGDPRCRNRCLSY